MLLDVCPTALDEDKSATAQCVRCFSAKIYSEKTGLCFSCTVRFNRKKQLLGDPNLSPDGFIRTYWRSKGKNKLKEKYLTRKEEIMPQTAAEIAVQQLSTPQQEHNIYELIPGFICVSDTMQQIARYVRKVAARDVSVLIVGETGVGKELIAQAIHKFSSRCNNPFSTIDCTTLGTDIVESELFGHTRGSFTGATDTREGLFPAADTGTVFIDEISILPMNVQPKLLRVLEQREYRKIGTTAYKKLDIRVIAATNEPLGTLVQERRFRQDLYHRLNVIEIRIPPLRERREDIPPLCKYLLRHIHSTSVMITPDAMDILKQCDWLGNVRELRNTLERALIMRDHDEDPITPNELPMELLQ